jgi:hypothetical protein
VFDSQQGIVVSNYYIVNSNKNETIYRFYLHIARSAVSSPDTGMLFGHKQIFYHIFLCLNANENETKQEDRYIMLSPQCKEDVWFSM